MTIKLIKTDSHTYTAEDTKYFTDITVSKHYEYIVNFNLKKGVSAHGFYIKVSDRISLLKEVKVYLASLDVIFESHVAKTKKDEADKKYEADKYYDEVARLNHYASKTTYIPDLGDILSLDMAHRNKCNTIGEYRKQVADGEFSKVQAKVEKVLTLSTSDYDTYAVNLFDTNSDLGDGGCYKDEQTGVEYNILVTAIVALGRKTFYVDAQGYDWARYVAL